MKPNQKLDSTALFGKSIISSSVRGHKSWTCRHVIKLAACLLSGSMAVAQVVVSPNQIVGTIEFSNSNPDVLAILNTELPMLQLGLQATSIGVVPPLQAFGNFNSPDTPTRFSYQLSVDTSNGGIAYNVLPRYVTLGGQTYTFISADSNPVFPEPSSDVVLNFSECVGILDVRWVDEFGNSIVISGGRMGAVRENPPGVGAVQFLQREWLDGRLFAFGHIAAVSRHPWRQPVETFRLHSTRCGRSLEQAPVLAVWKGASRGAISADDEQCPWR